MLMSKTCDMLNKLLKDDSTQCVIPTGSNGGNKQYFCAIGPDIYFEIALPTNKNEIIKIANIIKKQIKK